MKSFTAESILPRNISTIREDCGMKGTKSRPTTGGSTSGRSLPVKWAMRERTRAAATYPRPGIVPNGHSGGRVASEILKLLGTDCFAEFAASKAGGTLIWWNAELARQLGFQIPQTNDARAEFHAHLVSTFSLRSIVNGNATNGERITLFADKYGGEGVAPARGAGRAGFMPFGNLYVKGLGFT